MKKLLDILIIISITCVLACAMTGATYQFERVPYSGGETTPEGEIILKKGDQFNYWLITKPLVGAKEEFQCPLPGLWTVK